MKDKELRRQIEKLKHLTAIVPSGTQSYSHPLMVPKPNNADGTKSWRFTVDYRYANECQKSRGWPIPNIRGIFERLGRRRPKYFGIMDLTAGYHQLALSEKSRKYTAFITSMGCYEWT
jgi:hypothetical protein